MRAARNRAAFIAAVIVCAVAASFHGEHLGASADALRKLDPVLRARKDSPGHSRVIIQRSSGVPLEAVLAVARPHGAAAGRTLHGVEAQVAVLPNAALEALAGSPLIERISLDRPVVGAMERTGLTVGAVDARQETGFDGAGVGVAVIDSGVTDWHDDLTGSPTSQRVAAFVDFVGGGSASYDDYGHGTHVAGIIAGNGYDSDGARAGIAPGAHLVALKVLDADGRGYISDVIAAIDHAVANRAAWNIRVINLSVAAGVYESYASDPLADATKRAVRAGIVVVASAGNNGRNEEGTPQYGGITAPGNAPWVLTVGASSHNGTIDRTDDELAAFSSRGPTFINHRAKPDLVAPGVGIESLASPGSRLYTSGAAWLLGGTRPTSDLPYLVRSGTSMSAPVVSGTIALMLHANPALTPNAVKAILQYTAESRPHYDPLTQGAGFLNARGAVALSGHLASSAGSALPDMDGWSRTIIWGNRSFQGGWLTAGANAWASDVTWGATVVSGVPVWWGARCAVADCTTTDGLWTVNDTSARNVVWGAACEGKDCTGTWSLARVASIEGDTVVWGTTGPYTVVWGTAEGDTVVWGTEQGETVVWGTEQGETVVWGTACTDPSCIPIIWSGR